jgi:hypothetical protein
VELVSTHEIEGLFAIDLAFLQDFYGVINFGNQEEYEQLLRAQSEGPPLLGQSRPAPVPAAPVEAAPEPPAAAHSNGAGAYGAFGDPDGFDSPGSFGDPGGFGGPADQPVSRRGAIEEIPRSR